MRQVVLYLQVHQPCRLRRFRFFDIGRGEPIFDEPGNAAILRRVARRSYVPVALQLRDTIRATGGAFQVSLSITGTVLEQLERWAPEALHAFQQLVDTGHVELLGETSHHSLAASFDLVEHAAQVALHRRRMVELFGQDPVTFRGTELTLSTAIAQQAEAMGFQAILGEGAARMLGWRSPHRLYQVAHTEHLRLLLRSHRFSDDIAFRFLDPRWGSEGLAPARFARWLSDLPVGDAVVGLFMDMETFGEHLDADTGVLGFLARLPDAVLKQGMGWGLPREHIAREPVATLEVPGTTSWADEARDLSAWLGNDLQRAASAALYRLLPSARAASDAGAPELLDDWRRLSTSDHVYYMSTKGMGDGVVHQYFSPYGTPHEAFIVFMNVIDDLSRRLRRVVPPPDAKGGADRRDAAPR